MSDQSATDWGIAILNESARESIGAAHELVGWLFTFVHETQLKTGGWQQSILSGTIVGAQILGSSIQRGARDTDGQLVLTTDVSTFLIPEGQPYGGIFSQLEAITVRQVTHEGWSLVYTCLGQTHSMSGSLRLFPPKKLLGELELRLFGNLQLRRGQF
jgi:hypothetical protein